MPDNWAFVLGAYGLAAIVFGGYWRHLVRREREVTALGRAQAGRRGAGPAGNTTVGRAADEAPARGGRP
jgi:hypothetical protein